MRQKRKVSFRAWINTLNPESRVQFQRLSKQDYVFLELAWNDIFKAASLAVGTVSLGKVSTNLVALLVSAMLPYLQNEFKDRKTLLRLSINHEVYYLGRKYLLYAAGAGIAVGCLYLIPKTTVLVVGAAVAAIAVKKISDQLATSQVGALRGRKYGN